VVATVTITQREGYGLYENKRGYCASGAASKTIAFERGGINYPNCLEEVRNDGIELPYSDYCQKLANAGTNILRVKWTGRSESRAGGSYGMEPPPYGTYNIWQTALDSSNLTTYRSQQVTYPVDSAAWAASNVKELTDQCEAYGISLHVVLFESSEFEAGWTTHPWNSNNQYIDGTECEVADRGFISNAYEFYTDATAIQAAKDRIDFIVNMLGTNKAVVSWELFAEMTWLLASDFWGEDEWGAEMISHIRDEVTPWVETMAAYLRAADPYNRPIAMGLLRTPSNGIWPVDPDNSLNVKNEPMLVYPVDICCMNDYEGTFSRAVQDMRAAQAYTDKLLWITQMSPTLTDESPVDEPSPFLESKKLLWVPVCGERWGLGSLRWPGLREMAPNVWATGGYADSDLYSIPGITKVFSENVGWNANWDIDNYPFDDYIVATGTSEGLSYGDGENVTMLAEWPSGGSKTIDISNLSNGAYTFTYYDWTDGTIAGTLTPTAAGGSLSMNLDVTSFQDNMIVAHLIKD